MKKIDDFPVPDLIFIFLPKKQWLTFLDPTKSHWSASVGAGWGWLLWKGQNCDANFASSHCLDEQQIRLFPLAYTALQLELLDGGAQIRSLPRWTCSSWAYPGQKRTIWMKRRRDYFWPSLRPAHERTAVEDCCPDCQNDKSSVGSSFTRNNGNRKAMLIKTRFSNPGKIRDKIPLKNETWNMLSQGKTQT